MTFKIGNKVKVVKSAKEFDSNTIFCPEDMDKHIGETFTVSEVDVDDHVFSEENEWWWPVEALELYKE